MGLFDVHAHLTHEQLLPDVEAIVARAQAVGVTSIISNGLHPEDNERVLELSKKHAIIKPAFGFYPVDAVLRLMREEGVDYPGAHPSCNADDAIEWVERHAETAIAVGEIGLDGYWVPERFWPEQERVFCSLVRVAMKHDKPIIIHSRKRERRALELLDELGATRVNWHCFGGRVTLAREIAGRGHHLSIPANARRSQSFTRMLETLPRSQLLLETDCPYLGPDKERLNEPANVLGTVEYTAELWRVGVEEVLEQMTENFECLFRVAP